MRAVEVDALLEQGSTRATMTTPNLFILGAGKCGTTSLYHLLERHHDIKVSEIKEPSFFCSYFQAVKNPVTYFELFNSTKKYRVDASHVYFSNHETAPILSSLFPDAKFLVVLRNPKARALSLFQHMRRALHADGHPLELAESFHAALELEAERFISPAFQTACRHYFWNFMYMRSSLYDGQLARYFNLYPRERFLVMSLAELQSQPIRTIRSISEFLDLDIAGFGSDMPCANVAPPYKSLITPESHLLMDEQFEKLTERVDQLIGRPLDWSI
ncbi:sulfotransferase domain-containing protein [Pseudomonas sp. PDM16]|uniref:sulfotransferase domain-containing protein n=1 Tax=Pseudomonas sp. PDM16 TaxID=2769292 RepID=UPI001CE0947D|nr:sulfotransferase domain-containing protein [Pseudomonas sp. PDM16]